MQRPSNYNTRHGKAILDYLAETKDTFVTVAQIIEYLNKKQISISRPTVYRQLEKLESLGNIRKLLFNDTAGSCFQYVNHNTQEKDSCCLKCEVCNEIFNLECEEIDYILQHILENHSFKINDSKMIFYGKCKLCMKNN